MQLKSTHVVLGVLVIIGLGLLSWAVLRSPDEVVSEGKNVADSVQPKVLEAPPAMDALRPAPSTPAQVAVVSPAESFESPPSQTASQPIGDLSNEVPAETGGPLPNSMMAMPQQGPYPSPVERHLKEIDRRVPELVAMLELNEAVVPALTRIIAEHVRAERALWDEAKVYGDTAVDERRQVELAQRTLESIRQSPGLGDGMARVVERVLVPLVQDPLRPLSAAETPGMSIPELRRLLRGE